MKYKIFISAQPKALVYTVSSYDIIVEDGVKFLTFIDEVTRTPVKTPVTNCIINEVQ